MGRTIIAKVGRRGFLKGSAAFALAVQFLPFDAEAYETYPHGGLDMPNGVVTNPLVFVSIDRDGAVTIVAHRSEMGTGVRTSIPMIVADEMEADRSAEHTSELQSLMRISYAVFSLKKKKNESSMLTHTHHRVKKI